MNKAALLYDIACLYLDLPDMAKYFVVTHFQLSDVNEFDFSSEEMDAKILKRVMERKIYDDFRKLTCAFSQQPFWSNLGKH